MLYVSVFVTFIILTFVNDASGSWHYCEDFYSITWHERCRWPPHCMDNCRKQNAIAGLCIQGKCLCQNFY
ncbi:Knottin, scorpion toxin-like [Parasponia andersonii]|uniref:Knottin, scorpion toxin-like n=1 Tax=Parasponia andersonii TaxID=3476 RepID=A0A2P5C371_PARAD|nr:Knottin, scorpion toxin-like [Parasponia andersonii]